MIDFRADVPQPPRTVVRTVGTRWVRRRNTGWFTSGVVLVLLAILFPIAPVYAGNGANAEEPRIDVSTDPAKIFPNSELVTVRVEAKGLPASSSGHVMEVSLDAPPSSTWLTTDFPIVEGTRLLELSGEAVEGSFEFEYRFPIRGSYRMKVVIHDRGDENGSPVLKDTRTIHVSEHPGDVRNAAILFAGLFVFGLIGGVVVRRSALSGDGSPASGSGFTASSILVLSTVMSVPLFGHVPGEQGGHDHRESLPEQVENEHGELRVEVDRDNPEVGQLVQVDARFTGADSDAPVPARFMLECVNEEEGYSVFRMISVERTGRLTERVQFVEGAPHQVRVRAEPLSGETSGSGHAGEHEPLLAGTSVNVKAVEPPTGVVFRMLGLLLGVFVVGMIGGYLGHAYAGPLGSGSGHEPSN